MEHRGSNLFSQKAFVEICARTLGEGYGVTQIPVTGSGSPRAFYALSAPEPLRLRSFGLAPCGLYASPGWEGSLERGTLVGIVDRLKGLRARKFGWKVLFSHGELAEGLVSMGLTSHRESTHVLPLVPDYAALFARFSSTIRNQIRKARARGVMVREATDVSTVESYYLLHRKLAREKGTYEFIYPLELFLGLLPLRSAARLLVAEYEGKVVAGGLFFRDGASVVYWHGAADRDYSNLFPARLVFEEAIRGACESGAMLFNMGGSAGIASLEKYKESWGAERQLNWLFEWKNPLWESVSRVRRAIRPLRRSGARMMVAAEP